MIILGIDPGSRKTGFGVIKIISKKKIEYIDSGILNFTKTPTFFDRLDLIYESSLSLVEKYDPDEISIESLIYVKSVPALAKLAQARGAMLAAFNKKLKGKIFEYSPNLIKSSVSGRGHASKEEIDLVVKLLLGKDLVFQTNDESDALAIAICHTLLRNQKLIPNKAIKQSKSNSIRNVFKHLN